MGALEVGVSAREELAKGDNQVIILVFISETDNTSFRRVDEQGAKVRTTGSCKCFL